jgi:hypothetical protein
VLEGAALVEHVLADPAQRRVLRFALGARFFVYTWALEHNLHYKWALDHELHGPAGGFDAAAVPDPATAERYRKNSLTADEHVALQARASLFSWVLEQPPVNFGLSPVLQDEALLPAFPEPLHEALGPLCCRATLARALPYVAAWCARAGVVPPPAENTKWTERWQGALAKLTASGEPSACVPFLQAVFALEQGPVYFGYATWSLAAELLCELQRTGAAAELTAEWEAAKI